MSQLSFPRINFKGLVTIDVGTCNNDDYSSVQFPEGSPWAGQPLRPMDSQYVRANYITPEENGMTDEEWIEWATTAQTFVEPPPKTAPNLFLIRRDESRASLKHHFNAPTALRATKPKKVKRIPAEWNYHGSMGMSMHKVSITSTETAPGNWDDSLNGASLSYKNQVDKTGRHTALMNDVNPESVPCSQIFSDFITLAKDGKAFMQGKPHKAVTRRINFQRNTNINGPNGAGAYFQHAIPADFLEGQPILDYMKKYVDPNKQLAGVICRYYIARNLQPINTFQYPHNPDNGDPGDEWYKAIEAIYAQKGNNKNAGLADLIGTIAPWYEGEMKTITTGRIMNSANGKSFDLPKGSVSNGPSFKLAPIVFDVDYDKGLVSLDCIDAFPDAFDVAANPGYDPLRMDTNPKYNLGTVTLVVNAPEGSNLKMSSYRFGTINYLDPDFVERGCLVDFKWDDLDDDLVALIKTGNFSLLNDEGEALLLEEEYFIASDENCIFAEQIPQRGATENLFINDTNRSCADNPSGIGIEPEHSTFRLFRKGVEITNPSDMPQLEIQVFDTTPNEDVADKPPVEHIPHPIPGQPIALGVDTPGNRLAYFAINGKTVSTYGDVNLMNQYFICVRILPNDVDYSEYYVDPNAKEKVGNEKLTFEVIYEHVLRYYYLMFPAMNAFIPLNDKEEWSGSDMAGRLKARTSLDYWGCHAYMPRSRDLSQSRRELLHAWCNKFDILDNSDA